MGRISLDDPNFEMRNSHFINFIKDLVMIEEHRIDLHVLFSKVSNDQLQAMSSVPIDLKILYSLIGEFQINHKTGYAIFDFFLPQEAVNNIFLSDWASEELNERGLKNKFIFGVEHTNHNLQNFLFYDIDTLELGQLIPCDADNLIDILRIELSDIIPKHN
jgi:hypothetical protein